MTDAIATAAALIAPFEGFRANAYICPAGVCTIGYGTIRYPDGRSVKMNDPAVTPEQAEALLRQHLTTILPQIQKLAPRVTDGNKTAALLSFCHNLGMGAFAGSTLLKLINAGAADADIAAQFSRWNKAGGRVLQGLVRRRAAEAALWSRDS